MLSGESRYIPKVGVYEDRGCPDPMSILQLPWPSPTLHYTTFQLNGRHSELKTPLKHAKWVRFTQKTKPSWRLPDHPDGVDPYHHPCLHCPHHEDDVGFYRVSFWPYWPEIWACTGLKRHNCWWQGPGLARYKHNKHQNGKKFPPPVTITWLSGRKY